MVEGDRGAGSWEKTGWVHGKKGKKGGEAGFPRWPEEGEIGETVRHHTIFCNREKHKEAGANKKRQGTGIKGNGNGEV